MTVQEKFSVLIIGCGAIAGGYDAEDCDGPNILTHAKAFKIHQGFDLIGSIDMDPEVARKFSDTWDVPHVYSSLDQALNDRNFDVISICSSTPTHEKYLRELQNKDLKLIFCEKPLTDNIHSAREVVETYQNNLAVNYIRRFDPDIRALARDISSGKYGKFLSGKTLYNKGLLNNGSHMIDLLHLLLGDIFVKDSHGLIYDYWQQDPTISATLALKSGEVIELIGTDVRDGMIFDLSLIFEQAKITLTDFSHTIIIESVTGSKRRITTDMDRGMLNAVSNIYDHLTTGDILFSKSDNALSALEICHQISKMAGVDQ